MGEALVTGPEVPGGTAISRVVEVGRPDAGLRNRHCAAREVLGIVRITYPHRCARSSSPVDFVLYVIHLGNDEVADEQVLGDGAVGDHHMAADLECGRPIRNGEVATPVGRKGANRRCIDSDIDRRVRGKVMAPDRVDALIGKEPGRSTYTYLRRVAVVVVLRDGTSALNPGVVGPVAELVGKNTHFAFVENIDADLAVRRGGSGEGEAVGRVKRQVGDRMVFSNRTGEDVAGGEEIHSGGDVDDAIEIDVCVSVPVGSQAVCVLRGLRGAITSHQEVDIDVRWESTHQDLVGDGVHNDVRRFPGPARRVTVSVIDGGIPVCAGRDVDPDR